MQDHQTAVRGRPTLPGVAAEASLPGVSGEDRPNRYVNAVTVPGPGPSVRPSEPSLHRETPFGGADAKELYATVDLAKRRRELARYVTATLAGCGVILVAAAAVSVARASSAGSAPVPSAVGAVDPVAAAPTPVESPPAAPEPPPQAPATGTLRLQRPALPNRVWLDGQKLTTVTSVVSCGTHEIRFGAKGKPRELVVPCNGEVRVTK